MTEEEALLHNARASANDLTAKLIYADWLEDRGDRRAEYLRLHVALQQIHERLKAFEDIDPDWRSSVLHDFRPVIRLSSGETIQCTSLRQDGTYAGLLEGLPTRRMNQRMIDGLVAEERARGDWVGEPYVVPPPVRSIEYHGTREYPFGTPEAVPGITCVGRFHGPSKPGHSAELTVIWFQDEFAFPIAPCVVTHLESIDWAARAIEMEYDY